MAERRLGPFRLVQQLATGGMAEIYLATVAGVAGFEKKLALKVIHPNYAADPEFIRMLVGEAKLAVQLQHPNIVHVYDLGKVGDTYYISMELVDGADLFKVLRTAADLDRHVPFDVAAFIAAEVCEGLDYAHRKTDAVGRPLGIVHRDVSPQNVLLSLTGDVKLCDFGIAKAVAMGGMHTAAGVIKGKYYYMSPEQAWGDPVDHRSDVFSAGILLYEMLVGEMLYLEEDMERLLDVVRKAEVAPPETRRKEVPRELGAIAMRALRRRPADRWQSASEMGQALLRWTRQQAPEAGAARTGAFVAEIMAGAEGSGAVTAPTRMPPEARSDERTGRASGRGRDPHEATAELPRRLPQTHSLIYDLEEEQTVAGLPGRMPGRRRIEEPPESGGDGGGGARAEAGSGSVTVDDEDFDEGEQTMVDVGLPGRGMARAGAGRGPNLETAELANLDEGSTDEHTAIDIVPRGMGGARGAGAHRVEQTDRVRLDRIGRVERGAGPDRIRSGEGGERTDRIRTGEGGDEKTDRVRPPANDEGSDKTDRVRVERGADRVPAEVPPARPIAPSPLRSPLQSSARSPVQSIDDTDEGPLPGVAARGHFPRLRPVGGARPAERRAEPPARAKPAPILPEIEGDDTATDRRPPVPAVPRPPAAASDRSAAKPGAKPAGSNRPAFASSDRSGAPAAPHAESKRPTAKPADRSIATAPTADSDRRVIASSDRAGAPIAESERRPIPPIDRSAPTADSDRRAIGISDRGDAPTAQSDRPVAPSSRAAERATAAAADSDPPELHPAPPPGAMSPGAMSPGAMSLGAMPGAGIDPPASSPRLPAPAVASPFSGAAGHEFGPAPTMPGKLDFEPAPTMPGKLDFADAAMRILPLDESTDLAPGSAPGVVDFALAPTRPGTNEFGPLPTRTDSSLRPRLNWRWVLGLGLALVVIVALIVLLLLPEARRGAIEIVSFPVGARVRVDGAEVPGRTPVRLEDIDLDAPHRVAVTMPGYQEWGRDVVFEPGRDTVELHAVLRPVEGTLHVETLPAGAEVLVNGRRRGQAPLDVDGVPTAGGTTVEVRLPGYAPARRTVEWADRRRVDLSIALERVEIPRARAPLDGRGE